MREWGGVCKEMFTSGRWIISVSGTVSSPISTASAVAFHHVTKALTDSLILSRLFPTLVFFSHALRCASSCASTVTATSSHPWATSSHRGWIRASGHTSWRRWSVTWKTGTLGQGSHLLETAGDNREVTPGQIMTWKKKKDFYKVSNVAQNIMFQTSQLYFRMKLTFES